MSIHDDLGNRMKTFHEEIPKTRLMRRMPVIIRNDGCNFHTLAREFKRPFDDVLIKTMQETTKYLCENIQGCSLGYTESDKISLLLIDYQRFKTSAWLDYEIQKMCSISASMATIAFNRFFHKNIADMIWNGKYSGSEVRYTNIYNDALKKGAMFDTRVFNIPKEKVANYFYWRQLDCSKNSIQMVGRANFSHKELQNKSCNDIQDMLMTQKGIDWNDFLTYQKHGSCVIKENYFQSCEDGKFIKLSDGCSDPYEDKESENGVWRSRWIIDKDIPIFKDEGRQYIEKLVYIGK